MRWLKRLAILSLLAVVGLAAYAVSTAYRADNPVGFQIVRVESGSGPIAVAIWYPTSSTPRASTFMGGMLLSVARDGAVHGEGLPLIVMSHGNSGSALSHVDLAMALASEGYVVAAPTHAGDNYADQSRQGSPALFSQRADQVRATLDYVLKDWHGSRHVDPSRVGAYGMSAGAFTVVTLAGAVPDMAAIPEHCRQSPEFICKALEHTGSPLLRTGSGAGSFAADRRIKAVSIAAPGLGFTFSRGLDRVDVPVQIWSGSHDDTVPFATNAKVIADGLGERAEVHTLEGAQHLSFLAPCRLLKPAAACSDAAGFDREAAHRLMNAEVIRFFTKQLSTASTNREGDR